MFKLKTYLKSSIYWFIYRTGILHLFLKNIFKRKGGFPAAVINYHSFVNNLEQSINPHPTVTHRIEDFKKEILFLKKYFEIISLDQLCESLKTGQLFNRPTVCITVDDGNQDNYALLFPVIKEQGVPVTIFLTTGAMGGNERLWFQELEATFLQSKREAINLNGIFEGKNFSLKSLENKRASYSRIIQKLKNITTAERNRYMHIIQEKLGKPVYTNRLMMNWDEAREMRKNNVYFGAHTVSHPILTNVSLEEGKKEILESKKKIEQELGEPVKHFAFPNGRPRDFNENLNTYCKEIGFESVASCDYGVNKRAEDVWNLKRVGSEIPIHLFAVNLTRAFQG